MKKGNPRAPLARYGARDFSRRVTELYRDGSVSEAEKAEQTGCVPIINPPVSLGAMTAQILKQKRRKVA